jgi:hypothetical protein
LHWVLVHRPDKTMTKVWIVFDVSRKSYCDGKSLNGSMLTGPKLLNDVFDVHNGNRECPVLITADISKMFPRFKIPEEHQSLHRFWWQGEVYEFSSLIFGMAAAPFMANFWVLHLAKLYRQQYPHIHKVIKDSIYVDDLSISFESEAEAKQHVDDLIAIYEKHDLPFRQWLSSHPKVIAHLPHHWKGKGMTIRPEEEFAAQKTLGMRWHPFLDVLTFAVGPWDKTKVTTLRRLSAYAQTLFDPQGLLLPLTLIAKVIISVVCAARSVVKVDWDTPLEPLVLRVDGMDQLLKKWEEYTDSLSGLHEISFPRAVRSGRAESIQVHLITDASELAYGVTIYVRSKLVNEVVEVNLYCGKNRVAHLGQSRTIAEMELLGTLCGARLLDRVLPNMARVDKVYLWTDSRVCLHWISKPARQWKSWVAHRVTEIYQLTKQYQWRHVPGKQNPADLATRGLSMTAFRDSTFWKHGPKFLHGKEEDFPDWTPAVTGDDILPLPKSALMASMKNHGLLAAVPTELKWNNRDTKMGEDMSKFLPKNAKVVMVSKIGRHKGPKGKAILVPLKYPKFKIKPKIATTPEDLASPANWDFTGMNLTSSTVYIWTNIGLANNRVIMYERYSSFFKAARITAYVYRASRAPDNNPKHKWLRPEETHRALVRLILIEQIRTFGHEMQYAIRHKTWPEKSILAPLAPVVGPRGELRVGGRLPSPEAT